MIIQRTLWPIWVSSHIKAWRNGGHSSDDIFRTAFSWLTIMVFSFILHGKLFPRFQLAISHHWPGNIWPLHWRHNERDGVSNHSRLDCLLNRLFRPESKKTSKLRVTGLCEGIHPSQRASNAENVSIWWRHHDGEYAASHSFSQWPESSVTPYLYKFNGRTQNNQMWYEKCQYKKYSHCKHLHTYNAKALNPSDAHMRQKTRPLLVRWWLVPYSVGTKPLSEPMVTYWQLDHKEHISMKYYLTFKSFHSKRKCIWNYRLRNGGHFVSASMC